MGDGEERRAGRAHSLGHARRQIARLSGLACAATIVRGPYTFRRSRAVARVNRERSMIIVTGFIQARADTLDALRAASLEHVVRSRAEPGCLEHGVAVDVNDGLRLVFFERWSDRGALEAHFRMPASRGFAAEAAQLAAQPPQLHVYEANEVRLR